MRHERESTKARALSAEAGWPRGTEVRVASRSRSPGFITLPLMGWAAIAGVIVISLLTIALKVQSSRLESEQAAHQTTRAKFDAFYADTKRLGLEAQKRADDQMAKDKLEKEKADAENKDLRRELDVRVAQLRDARSRAGGGIVPAAPSGSRRPDLACFDRAEYQRAYGALVTEVRGGADEGTASTVDLNTAKKWAQP